MRDCATRRSRRALDCRRTRWASGGAGWLRKAWMGWLTGRARVGRGVTVMTSGHQVRSWLTSLDPEFDTKQADVCGLYLNPPENAIVVSIDEKTSIQAKQPIRREPPARPGKPTRREFESKRHGVQALLAALLVHSGKIVANVYDRNSRTEFIDFLDELEAE